MTSNLHVYLVLHQLTRASAAREAVEADDPNPKTGPESAGWRKIEVRLHGLTPSRVLPCMYLVPGTSSAVRLAPGQSLISAHDTTRQYTAFRCKKIWIVSHPRLSKLVSRKPPFLLRLSSGCRVCVALQLPRHFSSVRLIRCDLTAGNTPRNTTSLVIAPSDNLPDPPSC